MSINTKMTAIADSVRTLSGESGKLGLDAMSEKIAAANTIVDGQSDLIEQIKVALVGKAAGSGEVAKEEQIITFPTITENGSYEILPEKGKVISQATVNVVVPERYEEGYTEGYSQGYADNEPSLEPLNITENGTYTPSSNVDGFNSVVVNVTANDDSGDGNIDTALLGIIDGTISDFYIPSNIDTIRSGLFYDCDNLVTAVIPNHIISIGENAFSSCDNLVGVKVDGNIATFAFTAFSNCSNLTDIYVPWAEGAVDGAPWNATNATVHYNCNERDILMNGMLYVSSIKTSIDRSTYEGRDDIIYVVIPDTVNNIGMYAFEGCTNLINVEIGNNVTSIGYDAFYNCTSLKSVIIPDSVTTLTGYAFGNCSNLISAVIGRGVTTLFGRLFYNCSSLASVTIKNSVTTINDEAFYGCNALTDVYYEGSEAEWNAISIGKTGNNSLFNATIHYNTPM